MDIASAVRFVFRFSSNEAMPRIQRLTARGESPCAYDGGLQAPPTTVV